jgi:hypothetical protein
MALVFLFYPNAAGNPLLVEGGKEEGGKRAYRNPRGDSENNK